MFRGRILAVVLGGFAAIFLLQETQVMRLRRSDDRSLLGLYDLPSDSGNGTWSEQTSDTCQDIINYSVVTCQTEESWSETSFAEILEVLVDQEVVRRLGKQCSSDTWCLTEQEEALIATHLGYNFVDYCDIAPCLVDMDQHCLSKEDRLLLSSLLMLCKAKELNVSSDCILAIMKMIHVSLLPSYHQVEYSNSSQNSCKADQQTNCTGSCRETGTQLHCMCATCYHNMQLFKEFSAWQWFFAENGMEKCDVQNATNCTNFNEYDLTKNPFGGIWAYLRMMDLKSMIGVGVTCAGVVIALTAVVMLCAHSVRRRRSYTRQYVHYHEVQITDTEDLTKDVFDDTSVRDLTAVYHSID